MSDLLRASSGLFVIAILIALLIAYASRKKPVQRINKWESEVIAFLEELANWNVHYEQRKIKGITARQKEAQRLLAER